MKTALFLALALAAAGCGKKAPPQPAGPADEVTWPHSYPTPARVPEPR